MEKSWVILTFLKITLYFTFFLNKYQFLGKQWKKSKRYLPFSPEIIVIHYKEIIRNVRMDGGTKVSTHNDENWKQDECPKQGNI